MTAPRVPVSMGPRVYAEAPAFSGSVSLDTETRPPPSDTRDRSAPRGLHNKETPSTRGAAGIPSRPPARTAPYPASARPLRASRSLTTMRRSLVCTAPASLSLEKARLTATRLQPIIEASRSWV